MSPRITSSSRVTHGTCGLTCPGVPSSSSSSRVPRGACGPTCPVLLVVKSSSWCLWSDVPGPSRRPESLTVPVVRRARDSSSSRVPRGACGPTCPTLLFVESTSWHLRSDVPWAPSRRESLVVPVARRVRTSSSPACPGTSEESHPYRPYRPDVLTLCHPRPTLGNFVQVLFAEGFQRELEVTKGI